jgi:AraC-like DNA-binding protein
MEKEDELIKFFTKLFSKYLKQSPIQEIKIEDKSFEEILTYLKENYKENISLDELSQKFKLNSFYIIRLFKSQMNMTPHTFLLNLKINNSKEFLKKGYSLVDTALECGFTDQSHFHRNFLKIVATTPREYQLNFS